MSRPRFFTLDLLFANLGRARGAALVERSQRSLLARAREMLQQGRAVLVGQVELNEGDVGYDDWAILDKVWEPSDAGSPWEVLHRGAREALIYSARRLELLSSKTRRAGRAVKRQSPPRPVHVSRFEAELPGDPATTSILLHAAAGAKNGWRAPAAKVLLTVSWLRSRWVARRVAQKARRRGDHVAYLADVNDRGWRRLTRHEAEHVQHGPDVIGVIPARGWTAQLHRMPDVATYIEPGLHPGLHVRATFTRRTIEEIR